MSERSLPPAATLRFLKLEANAPRGKDDGPLKLAEAQHLLARDYGFASWALLKLHVAELEFARGDRDQQRTRLISDVVSAIAAAIVVSVVMTGGCGIDARTVRLTSQIARADGCGEPIVVTELDTLDLGTTTRYRAPTPPELDMFRFERRDGTCDR